MDIIQVVAVTKNNVIGKDNDIPWKIPDRESLNLCQRIYRRVIDVELEGTTFYPELENHGFEIIEREIIEAKPYCYECQLLKRV